MRIISGTLRGKTIVPPSGFSARPTTDFAKESLFNILENRLDFFELNALDLFSGTGNISYELASRGCVSIDAVEMNTQHVTFIKKTVQNLKLRQIHAMRMNVFDFLDICTAQYDLIFADPPYDLQGIETLPQRISDKKMLKPDGYFILEHAANYDFSSYPNFVEHRKYGAVNFSFFKEI